MAVPIYYDYLTTPLGDLLLAAGDDGLQLVSFTEHCLPSPSAPDDEWVFAPERLRVASSQLEEYFEGKRQSFDLKLAPKGTPFQLSVWEALRKIPYGRTLTYGELADMVQRPKACRAVGNANGKNPLVIIQPCHRVVAAGGKLGGFSSGLGRKRFLLGLEKGIRMPGC